MRITWGHGAIRIGDDGAQRLIEVLKEENRQDDSRPMVPKT